jgi:hypothetical protein
VLPELPDELIDGAREGHAARDELLRHTRAQRICHRAEGEAPATKQRERADRLHGRGSRMARGAIRLQANEPAGRHQSVGYAERSEKGGQELGIVLEDQDRLAR